MLNSGKKCRVCPTKILNILTLVLSEKKILNETKNHNPTPFELSGRSLIVIFILKTTGTFTPVHSAGYLILRNEFKSTQEVARQNIQVSFYIRSINPNNPVAILRFAILTPERLSR